MLAALSSDYYSRLEQSRVTSPSETALAALARAMRMSEDEQQHLFRLAGQHAPERHSPLAHVDPAMQYLLDALDPTTPAQVCDGILTVVAQNRAAAVLLGAWTGLRGFESNVTWRWFADPASREMNAAEEHERIGRVYAADLRAGLASRPGDRFAHGLVDDLLTLSEEFRRIWSEHEVAALTSTAKLLRHPQVGDLDFQCDVVLSPATGHRLVLFRPRIGSDTVDKIDFLAVLGSQHFS